MTPQDVVVVVPYYTNDLNPFEEIALTQLFRVLGRYPIRFVSPESLDVRYEAENGAPYGIERFPDRFFASWQAYGRFCEEPSFYARFSDYRYMLIYQTDAFVFSDRLLEFCDMGYDYIGADETWCFGDLKHTVGNGGLSLRRIEAMLRATERKALVLEKLYARFPPLRAAAIVQSEDQFFAFCAEVEELRLNWPERPVAQKFAMIHHVDDIYEDLRTSLPFGCHAWFKLNFNIWWPIIREYGYQVDEAQIEAFARNDGAADFYVREFSYSIILGAHHDLCRADLPRYFPSGRARIWGNGNVGRECREALGLLGIEIEAVFDRKPGDAGGRAVSAPTDENLGSSDTPLVIGTTIYAQEIAERLSALGFVEDRDFFRWSGIVDRWIALAKAEGAI